MKNILTENSKERKPPCTYLWYQKYQTLSSGNCFCHWQTTEIHHEKEQYHVNMLQSIRGKHEGYVLQEVHILITNIQVIIKSFKTPRIYEES